MTEIISIKAVKYCSTWWSWTEDKERGITSFRYDASYQNNSILSHSSFVYFHHIYKQSNGKTLDRIQTVMAFAKILSLHFQATCSEVVVTGNELLNVTFESGPCSEIFWDTSKVRFVYQVTNIDLEIVEFESDFFWVTEARINRQGSERSYSGSKYETDRSFSMLTYRLCRRIT